MFKMTEIVDEKILASWVESFSRSNVTVPESWNKDLNEILKSSDIFGRLFDVPRIPGKTSDRRLFILENRFSREKAGLTSRGVTPLCDVTRRSGVTLCDALLAFPSLPPCFYGGIVPCVRSPTPSPSLSLSSPSLSLFLPLLSPSLSPLSLSLSISLCLSLSLSMFKLTLA